MDNADTGNIGCTRHKTKTNTRQKMSNANPLPKWCRSLTSQGMTVKCEKSFMYTVTLSFTLVT